MSLTYTVMATYTGGLNQVHDQELFSLANQIANGISDGDGEYDHATRIRTIEWAADTEWSAKYLEAVLLLGSAPDLHISIAPPEES